MKIKTMAFLVEKIYLVKDDDKSDVFVHYDDLHKANMIKE